MAEMPEDELEPLITECPSCQTRFRVAETQLERAGGRVRCGACLTVFHGGEQLVMELLTEERDPEQVQRALDDLLDELASGEAAANEDSRPPKVVDQRSIPPAKTGRERRKRPPIFAGFEEDAARPERRSGAAADPEGRRAPAKAHEPAAAVEPSSPDAPMPEEPLPADGKKRTEAGPADVPGPAPAGEPAKPQPRMPATTSAGGAATPRTRVPQKAPAKVAVDGPPAVAARAIEPVTFGEPRPRRRPLVWLGIAAGLLLLMVQVLWYQFDDWAKEQHWRPLYAAICGTLGCELPVQQDLAELSTRNLVVRSHPREVGALLVNAVIVNRADFPQPFPVLELQFTTVRGNLAASRRFHPDEYLAGDARGMDLMPRRTPVQIELAIDDPGPDAVNYRLNFR